MTHEAGKGDKQRPTNYDKFNENFEKIFGRPSGITQDEYDNVDENFAKAHEQYKKDMACLRESQSDSQSHTEK